MSELSKMMRRLLNLLPSATLALAFFSVVSSVQSEPLSMRQPDLPKTSFLAQENSQNYTLPELPSNENQVNSIATSSDLQFVLQQVDFIGNHVISTQQLRKQCQTFIGKSVTLSDLEHIRTLLTEYYIQQGYLNSGVLLPDQTIEQGVVKFKVVEGRIAKINISGEENLKSSYILSRLGIEENEVFNQQKLQTNFQKLLSDPLIKRLNGRLSPAKEFGFAELNLEVTRAKPYAINLGLDNYHATSSGEIEAYLDTYVRNLSGYGDKLSAGVLRSQGNTSFNIGWDIPFNANNSRFFAEYVGNNATVVESSLREANIKNDYHSWALGVKHPLIGQIDKELSLSLQISKRHSQTSLLGVGTPFSQGDEADGTSNSSVLRFSQDFILREAIWVLALRSTINWGISAFNSTTHDNLADSRFVSWIGQAQWLRKMPKNLGHWLVKANLQLANDHLLILEKVAIGGPRSVRGYRANYWVKDNGYDASMAYYYPLLGDIQNKNALSMQLFAFADHGAAWDKGETSQSISSVGLGLQLKKNNISMELSYAHSLHQIPKLNGNYLQDEGIALRVSAEF